MINEDLAAADMLTSSFGSRPPVFASLSAVGGAPLGVTATPQADLVAESVAVIPSGLMPFDNARSLVQSLRLTRGGCFCSSRYVLHVT